MTPDQQSAIDKLQLLTGTRGLLLPECKGDEDWLYHFLLKELLDIALLINAGLNEFVEERKKILVHGLTYLSGEEAKDRGAD